MSFINTFQKMFNPGYMIRTAPEQAIIEELQGLRQEVWRLRCALDANRQVIETDDQELEEFIRSVEATFDGTEPTPDPD